DGSRIYVSNNHCCGVGNGTVTVLDAGTYTKLAVITVGGAPDNLGISPDGSTVYVPNNWGAFDHNSNSMSVINTASNTVVATVTVGNSPWSAVVFQAPPTTPTFLTAHSPDQYPHLSWVGLAGATTYNIYRDGTQVASTTSTSYTDSAAPEGTDTY